MLEKTKNFLRFIARPLAKLAHRFMTANQMTGLRFLAPFVFFGLFTARPAGYGWYALTALILFAITDLLDGLMAELEGKSNGNWGVLFDSFVDKIFVASVYIFYRDDFFYTVWFTLGGEAVILILAVLYKAYGPKEAATVKLRSTNPGKFKMTFEVITAGVMIAADLSGNPMVGQIAVVTGTAAIAFLFASFMGKLKATLG